MSRAVLIVVSVLAAAGCADDGAGQGSPCGELPDRCACLDWECQYGGCETGCYCDTDRREWTEVVCDPLPPDAGATVCPNAIASDESCGGCLKDHGAGASYCAASCSADEQCAGLSNAWGVPDMVCHPDGGYCTRSCTEAWECDLGDGVDYSCDDGRCTVCIDCF
jgi:hypothetical protein